MSINSLSMIKLNFILNLVSLVSSNKPYSISILSFIILAFIMSNIFSNELLSKLVSPTSSIIDSFQDLNSIKSRTLIIWQGNWVLKHNLVRITKFNIINQ